MSRDSSLQIISRILKYVLKRWAYLLVSIVLLITMSNMASLVPVYIKLALDTGIQNRDFDTTLYYSLLILLVTSINGVASFVSRYFITRVSQETVYRIRLEAFQSIQRQSMEFFDKASIGQLISRITNDTERIARFLSWRLRMLVYSVTLLILSLYYMLGINAFLSLIVFVVIVVLLAINIRFACLIRPLYEILRQQLGVLASISAADLGGIKTIKSLAIEKHEYKRFEKENKKFLETSVRAAKTRALYGNVSILVTGIAMSIMLYYGGHAIATGELTIGGLAAFLSYTVMLIWPLRAMGFIIGDLQRTVAAAKRVFEIIDASPNIADDPDAVELDNPSGEIVFENVSFIYPSTGKRVLNNISFRVRAGEKIVIVGPPGSGKSTILKLIMRFYEPDSGRILIDGIDLRKIKLSSLRKHIGYVPQEPFIFNRTIRENIAIGKPDASLDEIREAAKIAKIHDFIESLPNGYDTVVGERGIDLSGGQRQRIAIARALLSKPKILLLDDPVSNLDADTEKRLVDDLKEILRDKTAIIVTQRFSLARIADRILVLVDGRIIEEGSHEELLSKRGVYYKLYLKAMGGTSEKE
ncbi:MAG: ABC transporter ATP-binding protein [Thermoprotei archaeon]